MKIDGTAWFASLTLLGPTAVLIRSGRKGFARRLANWFLVFLGAEILLSLIPVQTFGMLWWDLHMPSALALGVDEIAERHGIFLSTVAHFADLLLWSVFGVLAPSLYRQWRRDQAGSRGTSANTESPRTAV